MARGDGRAVRILHVQHRQRDGRDQRGDKGGDHARPSMRSRQASISHCAGSSSASRQSAPK